MEITDEDGCICKARCHASCTGEPDEGTRAGGRAAAAETDHGSHGEGGCGDEAGDLDYSNEGRGASNRDGSSAG